MPRDEPALSRSVVLHPEQIDFRGRHTALSFDFTSSSGFVRTIRTGSGGQCFVDRKSRLTGAARNSLKPDLSVEPVIRLSMLHEGECFEINGIHYENQFSDVVYNNINFNGPLMPGEKDDELEEGGEWLTAVEENGKWIWIPSKDVEGPEDDASHVSKENISSSSSKNNNDTGKKWTSRFTSIFQRSRFKTKSKRK